MFETFSITNKTKGKPPHLPFAEMKEQVMGQGYELSLVFISEEESQELNLAHRKRDKPTNVLSFPLDKNTGEIFICLPYAKSEAPEFDRDYKNFVGFLFIHGLMHLKGYDHGSTMEFEEAKVREQFGI